MKTNEKSLKEKLGLPPQTELRFIENQRATRNPNFVVLVDKIPTYVMKVNPELSLKEKRIHEFLAKNPVVPTFQPVYIDDVFSIAPYIPDLVDTEIRNCFDLILAFHNESLALEPNAFKWMEGEQNFKNLYVSKFIDRLHRHSDLVTNYWKDLDRLVKFYEENPQEMFDGLPKILVHGDLQYKNIQTTPQGQRFVIDFEDAYYDSPSWDIARAIMDLEPGEMESFIESYSQEITIKDKALLKKAIDRDFVIRVVTDSIGRQQRFNTEKAKLYLKMYDEKYTGRILKILKKKKE